MDMTLYTNKNEEQCRYICRTYSSEDTGVNVDVHERISFELREVSAAGLSFVKEPQVATGRGAGSWAAAGRAAAGWAAGGRAAAGWAAAGRATAGRTTDGWGAAGWAAAGCVCIYT